MRRIVGYDVARAFAIAGMVVVNFKVAMGASERGPGWLQTAAGLLEGRAAATFVVLAGVGASLMTARARREGDLLALDSARKTIIRRALFLLVVGYLFVPVWPPDILHYYAFYLGIGAFLLAASDRALWGWALLSAALFSFLYWFAGYWDQLDPVDLTYDGFWTPVGLVRNLVFNGWHPILPWVAFYLGGMWLGRREMGDPRLRRRILVVAVLVAVAAEVVAAFNPIEYGVVVKAPDRLGVSTGLRALLSAEALPPGPVFLLAAGGTAIALVMLCVEAGLRRPDILPVRWAAVTGRMALTIYFAHVLVGMGTLEAMGKLGSEPLWFALASAGVFVAAAVLFAVVWGRYLGRGPVERLMRRLAG